jgi:hypothetical protein
MSEFTTDELALMRKAIGTEGTGPLTAAEVDAVHRRLARPAFSIVPPVAPSGDPGTFSIDGGGRAVTKNQLLAVLSWLHPDKSIQDISQALEGGKLK